MGETSGMSPADIMALSNNDGLGGNNWFGMIILFALIFGWGGFGGGQNNAVQQGFDNQNTIANQRETLAAVTAGTAQAVAATNQTFHDSLMANQGLYNEIQRDIAANAVTLANLQANQNECCCSVKQLIMQGNAGLAAQIAQNEYNNAMRDAATNANFTAQINGLQKEWYQDKIAGLNQRVASLEGALGNQGIQARLDAIEQNMVTYPRGWVYSAGSSPFCNCGNYNI